MQWFKNLSDEEISKDLINTSEYAINLMIKGEKEESIQVSRSLENKINSLKEHIASIKGFYFGYPLYDVYQQMLFDLNGLKQETNEKMLLAYKKLGK
jgi:predicted translin family RNA/ssDNA-binding protein